MKRVFLDTSFAIALHVHDDQEHQAAVAAWQSILSEKPGIVTTSFVFDEIVTFLNSRDRHQQAVVVGEQLIKSPAVEMIHVDVELFDRGWKFFIAHQDKRYSLTDCISFVVMQDQGMQEVLTYDRHFEQAGFMRFA